MVWSWMAEEFVWTSPSLREPIPPLRGYTWAGPPNPGMMKGAMKEAMVERIAMTTEATTESMVSGLQLGLYTVGGLLIEHCGK